MNLNTTNTQTPQEIREQRALYERSLSGVAAAVIGNCAAGVGVAFIAAVICYWVGVTNVTLARVSMSAWLLSWGAIMALWFSQDELAIVKAQHEGKRLAVDLDAAEAEIEKLEAERLTLQAENSFLRFKNEELTNNRNFIPAVGVESQAYQDARTLINEWGKTKKHPSRRSVNLSDDRHKAAVDVLQAKGVVIKPRENQVTWVAPDASTALLLLAAKQPVPLGWSGGGSTPATISGGEAEQ